MSTRERIIQSAQLLYARNGYAATGTRDITEHAGVNVAAVNYHFGSKENLLVEILDRVIGPINEQRLALLDNAEASGETGLENIIRAFLLPDLTSLQSLRATNPDLPRFVARMYNEGSDLMYQVMGRQFAEIQHRFLAAFSRGLPDLDRSEVLWRLNCVVGIIVYLFAGIEGPGSPPMLGNDVEANLARLVSVVKPLLTASQLEDARRD